MRECESLYVGAAGWQIIRARAADESASFFSAIKCLRVHHMHCAFFWTAAAGEAALQLCGRARRELLQRATSPHQHQRDFGCFSVQHQPAKQKDGSLGTLLFGAANGFNYFLLAPTQAFLIWKWRRAELFFRAENELPDCPNKILSGMVFCKELVIGFNFSNSKYNWIKNTTCLNLSNQTAESKKGKWKNV